MICRKKFGSSFFFLFVKCSIENCIFVSIIFYAVKLLFLPDETKVSSGRNKIKLIYLFQINE